LKNIRLDDLQKRELGVVCVAFNLFEELVGVVAVVDLTLLLLLLRFLSQSPELEQAV